MHFWLAFRYLRFPSPWGLLPPIMALFVYEWMRLMPIALFGRDIAPLGIALSVGLIWRVVIVWPTVRRTLKPPSAKLDWVDVAIITTVYVPILGGALSAAVFAPPMLYKLLWSAFYFGVAIYLFIDLRLNEDNERYFTGLPWTWANLGASYALRAGYIWATMLAVLAVIGLSLAFHSTEQLWLLFATLGRVVLEQMFRWLTIAAHLRIEDGL